MRNVKNITFGSKKQQIIAATLLAASAFSSQTMAQLYWDVNGTAAGAGGPNAVGTWGGTNNWTTDSTGNSATSAWTAGSAAVFSAGTDATGGFTVTLSGVQTATGLTIAQGTVSLAGSAISMASGTILVQPGATLSIPIITQTSLPTTKVVKTYVDGGTLRSSNNGNGGSFWSPNSDIYIANNGLTIDVPTNTASTGGPLALIYGSTATSATILSSAGATTTTLTKTGPGEFRYQGTGVNTTGFNKLVVLNGLYRIGHTGTTVETDLGFGASPTSATPDSITLNGGNIGVSIGMMTDPNRGLTVGANGGGFNMSGAPLTFTGNITGASNVNLNINGGQLLVVSGDETNFLGNISGSSMNLKLNSNMSAGKLSGNGTVTITPSVALTAGNGNGNSTFSGTIAGFVGGGSFVKAGTGTLTLSGTNTYWGDTYAAGTIVANSGDNALGSPGVLINLDGGTVKSGTTGITSTRSLNVTGNGGGLNGGTTGLILQGTGDTTINGKLTIGGGTVTFNRSGGTVNVGGGSVSVSSGATANFNGATPVLFDGGSSADLTVNGTASFGADNTIGNLSGAATGVVNTNAHALAINQTNDATFSGALNASGSDITKNQSGKLTVKNVRSNSLTINDGKVLVAVGGGNSGTSSVNGLTLNGTTTLDVGDHALIVNYSGSSPVATIRSEIVSGYNGGAWGGNGLASAAAASDTNFRTGLGYAEASQLGLANGGTFGGQPVPGQAVLVKYTYYGDNDLDGKVTLNDFSIFVDGYNGLGSGWVYGDYDYSGTIDPTDFAMFVDAYKNQGSSLSALDSAILSNPELSTAQRNALLNVVPEPGTLSLLAVAAGAMGLRRRRQA